MKSFKEHQRESKPADPAARRKELAAKSNSMNAKITTAANTEDKTRLKEDAPTADQHLKWAITKFKRPRAHASNMYHYHLQTAKKHRQDGIVHDEGSPERKKSEWHAGFHMLRAKHFDNERKTAPIKVGRQKRKS